MAKEATPAAAVAPAVAPKESMSMQKILMIGVPIVVVQMILMYFVFVKFIAPSMSAQPQNGAAATEHEAAPEGKDEVSQVLVIKDLIINPAGTNGTRFLLTTVGLEVPSLEIKTELEQKEIQTRDILNSVLTSKGLDELTVPQFKETLRKEILEKLNANLKTGKIKNVYFSKFIIQ